MLISSSSISFGLITSGARWLQGWTCQQLLWGRIHSGTPNRSMNNSWKMNSEVAVHSAKGRAESYSAERERNLWIRHILIDVFFFPLTTLSFPAPAPLIFVPPNKSSEAPAVPWSRSPFFRCDSFSRSSCCRNLTVLLHCWLIDDVSLEEMVPPAAKFFKMFFLST